MKTLLLYKSASGNTKKYAEEIAASLGCDILPFKKFKWKKIEEYDCFIFGGWVRGKNIMGLNDFLSHYDDIKSKDVIVFSVGMSIVTKETRQDMISANILDLYHVRYYQLRGSFDYSKLSFANKILMSNSLRMIASDPNSTADARSLLDLKERPIEYYDREGIEKICSVVRKIDAEKKIKDI